jgi:seryl-tRNA synthetase
MKDLRQFHSNADAGGGAAPDGAQTPEPTAGADKDWKAEADRKEALLKSTQTEKARIEAELAKLRADAEKLQRDEMEKQGKFKELNESLLSEKAELEKQITGLKEFQETVLKQKQVELETLITDFDDEKKAVVVLGKDIDAQIVIAKSLSAQTQPAGSLGPRVAPGTRQEPTAKTAREQARKNRDLLTFYQTMPVITGQGD